MKTYVLTLLDGISPARLMTWIGAKPDWCGFWLHNNGQDVIGIMPKIRWVLSKNADDVAEKFVINCHHRSGNSTQTLGSFDDFKQTLIAYHKTYEHKESTAADCYHHGLMGYVSYDIAAHALNSAIAVADVPLAYFGHYDYYLICHDGCWQLCAMDGTDENIEAILAGLNCLTAIALPLPKPIALYPCIDQSAYRHAFDATIAYLKAGDAYQVNLTQCWQGLSCEPIFYHLSKLFHATHAPFSGYIRVDDFEVLSVSPELFFKFNQQDDAIVLTTKPIKGTRPRSGDMQEDNRLKYELAHSTKDLAENVMIVDLLRNDLGKYAKFGAVSVPVRFAIESFSNVHHMVSTVVATLGGDNDTPTLQVLFDSLPAGSITGSPKKRACELIYTLEYLPRGAYCGTMGYLNFNNTGQWNVLIRTLQAQAKNNTYQVQLWAGGGVTVLSDGDDEYQESLDKVAQIKAVLAQAY